ncbi:hypothetical protein [Erwinia sp. SLM-02]|uniref:hypothetical protein n=1 Tax=Erwinia sp. SLM-02 TaxID=3020057 RepID=UPI0030809348
MNFKWFLVKFILAFFCGYLLLYFISGKVELAATPTPWVMITLLLFPSTYCAQAFFKLPEADEHPSLTSDELRRLKPIIKIKSRRLTFIFIYYLVSATIISIGFFSIPNASCYFRVLISFFGGLLISSLYSFFLIKSTMDEIQSFKSKLIHRAEAEKKKRELLDSIKKAD